MKNDITNWSNQAGTSTGQLSGHIQYIKCTANKKTKMNYGHLKICRISAYIVAFFRFPKNCVLQIRESVGSDMTDKKELHIFGDRKLFHEAFGLVFFFGINKWIYIAIYVCTCWVIVILIDALFDLLIVSIWIGVKKKVWFYWLLCKLISLWSRESLFLGSCN